MKKKRLTIENRLLIDQLLRLNYNLKDIANIIETESSTISREIKKRRVKGNILPDNCNKVNRFPFVCNGCLCKSYCKKQKYYYNYLKAQENYVNTLKNSRIGIDMTIDEIDFWNDYFKDKIKNKNQPITHLFNSIENQFSKSIQTFYNYITTLRFDNCVKSGRKLIDLNEYLENHPNASVVEMDTVIGKCEDKKCIMTLYFKNCKLMLMFLIDKYKPNAVKKIFKKLQDTLGIENFKMLFEVIVTDNGWEFSKPGELEIDYKTSEKCINIYYCEPYSSWQKGGIERNHEFIRYIIPKGITFDKLINENIIDMMNNINNVSRRSLDYKTPYLLFKNIYGENITKKLHLKPIKKDEVNLSYKILIK